MTVRRWTSTNMRKNGVRSLVVVVDDQPGHLYVPSFKNRMRCSNCGSPDVTVMPAWGKLQQNHTRPS
jgi:hypothetical protein